MKFLLSFVVLVFALTASSEPRVNTQPKPDKNLKPENYGLYRDAQTGRFFSNGSTEFSVKPKGNSTYLERIEVSVDDGPFKPYSGKLSFNSEGTHKIKFRAVDPVLNWSPIQSFSVIVDKTPPVTRFTWKGPKHEKDGKTFISPKSQLIVTAEDSLSGVSHHLYRQPGDTPVKFKVKKAFSKAGDYEYEFTSSDKVGNASNWQKISFIVDDASPATTAKVEGTFFEKGEKSYINYGSKIRLTSNDTASGVEHVEYKVNEGPIVKYAEPFSVGEAKSVISYRGKDSVGNVEPWKKITLFQDSTAPKVQFSKSGVFKVIAGTVYAKPGFKLSATINDTQSGISTSSVSKSNSQFSATTDRVFEFTEPGRFQFEYKVTDKVGNQSEINPISVVIDDKSPKSKVTSTEKLVERDKVFLSGIPNQLVITSDDGDSGVDFIEASYDGKSFFKVNGAIDLATWKSKRNTLYYRAVDRIGNREATQEMVIQLLTQGPVVDLFVEGSDSTPNVPLSKFKKSEGKKRVPASTKKKSPVKGKKRK